MLLIVVARSRLDRYEELLWQLGGWPDVKVILDRREDEGRSLQQGTVAASVNRRRVERRRRLNTLAYLKLGWDVIETAESVS